MRSGGNSAVNIVPDWTVFVQAGMFFIAFFILNKFLFKPVLKLVHQRRKLVDEAGVEASAMREEADNIEEKRRNEVEGALAKAHVEAEITLKETRLASEKAILSARKESALIIASAEEMCRRHKEDALKIVAARSCELSRDIVLKLTEV